MKVFNIVIMVAAKYIHIQASKIEHYYYYHYSVLFKLFMED
jgi:hypothetical protein